LLARANGCHQGEYGSQVKLMIADITAQPQYARCAHAHGRVRVKSACRSFIFEVEANQ
jgi:hypothetical protein